MPRQSSVLTEKQSQAVNMLADGVPPTRVANTLYNTDRVAVVQVPVIKEALAKARQQLTDITMIRRVDVVNGILDQIHNADLMSDPSTAIKGWVEIGKMLGHYEPLTIKHEVTLSQGAIAKKMEVMSDDELLRIIDGEASRVD